MDKQNDDMLKKSKKVKRKRIRNYSFLFLGLFGVTAATAYFLIPSKKATTGIADPGTSSTTDDSETDPMTPAQHFTSALMAMKGLSAQVDSFTATMANPTDSTKTETLSLKDTSIQFVMNGWPDISFTMDATVDLNGVSRDINLSFVDSNLYLSTLGMKYKTQSETMSDLLNNISLLGDEAGIGEVDFGSLDTSKATSLLNNLTSSGDTTNGFVYTLPLDDAKTQIITMKSDGEYNLTGVSASNLVFNGITLNFNVTTDLNSTINTANFVPTDSASYLDIDASWKMINKVAHLIMTPTFGVTMSLDLTKNVTESSVTKTYEVADIAGNVQADITSNNYSGALAIKAPVNSTLKSDYAALSADAITSQSVSAAYVPTTASDGTKDATVYATYNDALNLKMTTSVAKALVTKMKKDLPAADLSSATKLFSYITDSTLMKAVSQGQYEKFIPLLDSIVTSNNKIVITVPLKDLGLGDDANVVVTLDATDGATSLASIAINKAAFSNYDLNATFALSDYTKATITDASYETLDKLPNIYDQFYALSQDTKAEATITGSIMGYDATAKKETKNGATFTGDTEFDANQDTTKDTSAKSGTGEIAINQIKEGATYQTHKVAIDVRGTDQMLFRYTSSASSYKDYLNGKFTIDTLNDMIALVKKLTSSTDARYTKFLDSMKETMATTVVGQIMSKDYETLLRNKVLTKLDVYAGEIDLVIDKKLLGSSTDIAVTILLDSASKVSSISLTDFAISGVNINTTITLGTYDAAKLSTLPNPGVINYLDFSDIEVLMQFGITTSELNYFHITATAGVNIGSLIAVDPTLDFYISVDGATVKVIGTISGIPLVTGVNGSHYKNIFTFGGTRTVTFYYQTGYCYLAGHDKYKVSRYNTNDYLKSKDTDFVKNILHYLLADVLEASDTIQSQVDTSSSSSSSTPIKFEDVLTAFTYDGTSNVNQPVWKMTLDAGVLANDSKLKDLSLTITGTDKDQTDTTLDGYLTHMVVDFNLVAVVKINITLDANLVDIGTDYSNKFATDWQTYIDAHANDTLDTIVVK